MTYERMIELLRVEHECVLRKSHGDCDSRCENCDLVQDDGELHEMYSNVIALLKAQEPSLLDIGDILTSHQVDVYLEDRSDKKVFPITLLDTENTVKSQTAYFFPMIVMPIKGYGKTWRCWTSRPTKEQSEAEPWQS